MRQSNARGRSVSAAASRVAMVSNRPVSASGVRTAQVDAVKRNCIKALPHTLVMHLKRFEFDYETMARWKIKDRRACSLTGPLT